MIDFASLFIEQLEEKLSDIKKQADLAEDNLNIIQNIRKKIYDTLSEIEKEYKRKERAILIHNQDTERINRYCKKVLQLSEETLPVKLDYLPSIESVSNDRDDIYNNVNRVAIDFPEIMNRACGIYFLLRDNDIVYIGQSVDCYSRICCHAQDSSKKFNRVCYIQVEKCDLDSVERTLICMFKPEYNKIGVTVSFPNESIYRL